MGLGFKYVIGLTWCPVYCLIQFIKNQLYPSKNGSDGNRIKISCPLP